MTEPRALRALRVRLGAPRDASALAVFRIAFGLLVAVSAVRFIAYGWVDTFFVRPTFHFKYWGFHWVPGLPGQWAWVVFAALAVCGLLVAAGLFYRPAVLCLFLLFTWIQLVDVTTYLNHYYLVSLLAALLFFIPAHRAWSLDAWRRPGLRASILPAWCTWLLRFQVATVYFFAGMAKLTPDWLLHAQPLNIWLTARTELPLLGPLLAEPWVAYLAAWFGFLFDTTVAFFLLARRTRPFAFAAVVVFHVATRVLFPIGMFPWIMITAALVFFDPAWPRVLLARLGRRVPGPAEPKAAEGRPFPKPALAVALAFCLVQVALPLRTHLYGGNVLWHEQGMRFSWRVMAREKNGAALFKVRDPDTGHEWHVSPRRYLSRIQEREMSVQPDLVLQLARRIGEDFERQLGRPVEVRADVKVSLNGRPAAPLVDPGVDLTAVEDGLAPKTWILAAPGGAPPHLRPRPGLWAAVK